jgi:hypothetical protein
VNVLDTADDGAIVQVPDAQVRKLSLDLESERMKHEREKQRTERITLLHSCRTPQHTASEKQVRWIRVAVLNPSVQAWKFLINLRKHHGTIHHVESVREINLEHDLAWVIAKLLRQLTHCVH